MNDKNPTPESYISCPCCGAILGYRARLDGVIRFYIYVNPPTGVRSNLATRSVRGRILSGDAYCPHCDTWTELDLVRPWEHPKNNAQK